MTQCNFRFHKERNGAFVATIGAIGVGKSVFTRVLGEVIRQDEGACRCFYEPASSDDEGGASVFLPKFYNDQKRWAFAVQVEMLTRRLSQHKLAQALSFEGVSSVADSLWMSDGVFVNMLEKSGSLERDEADLYYRLFSEMSEGLLYPTAVIYLTAKPATAHARLTKRMSEKAGRSMECGISLEYLSGLISEYNELTAYLKQFCHVIVLDWDADRTESEIFQEAKKTWEVVKTLRRVCPIGAQLGI